MLEHPLGLDFRKFSFFHEEMIEIPILTKLCNNVHIIGSLIDIMEFDNIIMMDHFHDVYLGLDIFQVVGI